MTHGAAAMAASPGAYGAVIAGLPTVLDPDLMMRASRVRAAAAPRAASRGRAFLARLRELFEDHGDYFAELERSLPAHERDRRRARRDGDRLVLIAMLTR